MLKSVAGWESALAGDSVFTSVECIASASLGGSESVSVHCSLSALVGSCVCIIWGL